MVQAMSNRTISMSDQLYDYVLKVSLREPPILKRLREETAKHPKHGMQISPEQGQFMRLLVRMMGASRCIEVGVFTGYSSLSVALALPDEGRIIACDAGRYDFAFIDADKNNYLNYYERLIRLLRPGGLMAVDNVLWSGSVIDKKDKSVDTMAIRKFNEVLHADNRIELSLVPIGDGLTLARKRP